MCPASTHPVPLHSQIGPPGVAMQSHISRLHPEPHEHERPTSPVQLPLGGLGGQAGGGGGGHVRMTMPHTLFRQMNSGPHCVPKVHSRLLFGQYDPRAGGDGGHVVDASKQPSSLHAHVPPEHEHWLQPSGAGQLVVELHPGSGLHVPPSPSPPSFPPPSSPPPSSLWTPSNVLPPHAPRSIATDATAIDHAILFMSPPAANPVPRRYVEKWAPFAIAACATWHAHPRSMS